jgi:hypothetical protein
MPCLLVPSLVPGTCFIFSTGIVQILQKQFCHYPKRFDCDKYNLQEKGHGYYDTGAKAYGFGSAAAA